MNRLAKLPSQAFCIFSVMLFILSCDTKNPTQPLEPKQPAYHLVYTPTYNDGIYKTLVFNTKTKEIVDSTNLPEYGISYITFTHDGSLAVYSGYQHLNFGLRKLWVEDFWSGETLSSVEESYVFNPILNYTENYLLTQSGNIINLRGFPDLTPIFTDTIEDKRLADFLPNENKVVYLVDEVDSLFFIDFTRIDSIVYYSMPLGNIGAAFHPIALIVDDIAGKIVITTHYPSMILVYDINVSQLQHKLDVGKPYFFVTGNIDGNSIYMAFGVVMYKDTNSIEVYSIDNNTIQTFAHYQDLGISEFTPQELVVSPDKKTLYALSNKGSGNASVVGFNLMTGDTVAYFNPPGGTAFTIGINPKNLAE